MTTDELAVMLATRAEADRMAGHVRRLALGAGAGMAGAFVMMAVTLGIRPTLAQDAGIPMFWIKFAFVGAVAAAGWIAALRLGRPGASLSGVPVALAAPFLTMWALAAIELAGADGPARAALVFGTTAAVCPLVIAALSLPVLVATLWALSGFAPTRLAQAGAAAGLFAGACGAFVYTFHCPELAAPFLGIWYVLGMLIPAIVGALLGPRLLRW
jgi:hypothetical protein